MRLHTVVTQAPIILYATDNNGEITFLEGKELEDWGEQAEDIINSEFNPYHTQLKISENLSESFEVMIKLGLLKSEIQFIKTAPR
jgi:hypothetical protein